MYDFFLKNKSCVLLPRPSGVSVIEVCGSHAPLKLRVTEEKVMLICGENNLSDPNFSNQK